MSEIINAYILTGNRHVGDKIFETVPSFKYLDNVKDKEGRISECVNDRIQAGNRAYAANYVGRSSCKVS